MSTPGWKSICDFWNACPTLCQLNCAVCSIEYVKCTFLHLQRTLKLRNSDSWDNHHNWYAGLPEITSRLIHISVDQTRVIVPRLQFFLRRLGVNRARTRVISWLYKNGQQWRKLRWILLHCMVKIESSRIRKSLYHKKLMSISSDMEVLASAVQDVYKFSHCRWHRKYCQLFHIYFSTKLHLQTKVYFNVYILIKTHKRCKSWYAT